MHQSTVLEDLRARIARIEGAAVQREALPFGLNDVDQRLPGGGIATGALHEIAGSPELADDASATIFLAGNRKDVADVYRVSRADVVKNPMRPDPRDGAQPPLGRQPRDIFIPDLRLGSGIVPGQQTEGIKIKPCDFR